MIIESRDILTKQAQIQRMWSEVPATVFEQASSSQGMFEHEEIVLIGRAMSELFDPNEADLLLLGSATAFREEAAIHYAQEILQQPLHFSHVTAVDIAPQFLQGAKARLRSFHESGMTDTYSVVQQSLEQIPSDIISAPGPIIMGVYNLDCLLHNDKENDGELVGLDQYGEEMREILGSNTKVLPLFFRDGAFIEGEPIVAYKASNDYEAIRKQLREYSTNNPEMIGLRVHISHDEQSEVTNKPTSLFISTWFNPQSLAEIMTAKGFHVSIRQGQSQKGVVLVLERPEDLKPAKSCTLIMNNVVGNLATPQLMTEFFSLLPRLGSGGIRRGR